MVTSVLSALFWLIFASLLNVTDYGQVNYFLSIATVGAGVGLCGLNITITSYLAKGEKDLLSEVNSFTFISGFVLLLIFSALNWTVAFLAATTIFFNMTLAELLGTKNYQKYALFYIGQKTAQIVLSLLFYYYFGTIGIIFGYFLATLLFSYNYLKSVSQSFTIKFEKLKKKRKFALHSYGYNLMEKNLAMYLDKLIIGTLFGYYSLGLYQLGFQFFMFLTVVPTSLYQYLLPEQSSGKNKKHIQIIGFFISIAVSIIAFFSSGYLIREFFPIFVTSINLVKIMSLAVIPSTIVSILVADNLGKEKSQTVFYAGLIYLIALVTFIIVLQRIFGVLGFALAIVFSYTLQATYLYMNRKVKNNN